MAIITLDIHLNTEALEALQFSQMSERAFPIAAKGLNTAVLAVMRKWKGFAGGSDTIVGVIPPPPKAGMRGVSRKKSGSWEYTVYSDSQIAE
jgi:hypothetical protein